MMVRAMHNPMPMPSPLVVKNGSNTRPRCSDDIPGPESRIETRALPSAAHELHVIEVSDDVCKRQLRARSAGLPEGTRWTSDAEFDAITAYFDPPSADEGFTIVRHARA